MEIATWEISNLSNEKLEQFFILIAEAFNDSNNLSELEKNQIINDIYIKLLTV